MNDSYDPQPRFTALLGAVVAAGLVSWQQRAFPSLGAAAVQIGAILVTLLVFVGPFRLQRLPAEVALPAVLGVMTAVNAAFGVSLAAIAVYLLVGGVAGWLAGWFQRPLPGVLTALTLMLVAGLHAQRTIMLSPRAVAHAVIVAIAGAAALNTLMSGEKERTGIGYACADTLLVLGLWVWLARRLAAESVAHVFWIWLLSGALAAVLFALVRFIIWERIVEPYAEPVVKRWLLARQLDWPGVRMLPGWLALVTHMYERMPPQTRRAMLDRRVLRRERPLWQMLAAQADSSLKQDTIAAFQLALRGKPDSQQAAVQILQAGVRQVGVKKPDLRISNVCLALLLPNHETDALEASWRCIDKGRYEPLWYCLTGARVKWSKYVRAIVSLGRYTKSHKDLREIITQFLQSQLRKRLKDMFGAAPSQLPTSDHHAERVTAVALALERSASDSLWSWVAQSWASDERERLLKALTSFIATAPSLEQHIPVIHLLGRGLHQPDPGIWQGCLGSLEALVSTAAAPDERARMLQEVERGIQQGAPAIWQAYLDGKRPIAGAAVALIALADRHPQQVSDLYQMRRADEITPALLNLSKRLDLRPRVWCAFKHGLQLASAAADPQRALAEVLFPFRLAGLEPQIAGDQAKPNKPEFHIEEAISHPDVCITGSQITAWAYSQDKQITDMVLAGHANLQVCTEVTARLSSWIMQHGDVAGEHWLLVVGACKLHASAGASYGLISKSLQELWGELRQHQRRTGLIAVSEPTTSCAIADVHEELRRRIGAGIQSGAPVILHRGSPGASARAVVLPFYIFGTQGLCGELSFKLSSVLLGTEYQDLLDAHCQALKEAINNDTLRKKAVYEDWLANDTEALLYRGAQLLQMLGIDETRRGFLAERLSEDLLDDQSVHQYNLIRYKRLQQPDIAEWLAQQVPEIQMRPVTELTADELDRLISNVRNQLPIHLQDTLAREDAEKLWERIRAYAPEVDPTAWNACLGASLARDIPTRGWRNYPQATVETDSEEAYASQLLAILALPYSIREDKRWIRDMDERMATDEHSRQMLGMINRRIFLDAFLRNVEPDMLSDKRQRDIYDQWQQRRYKLIWADIHKQLLARGLRMDPLQQTNVIFSIQDGENNDIQVTPYFVATDQSIIIFLHRHIGMTYYLDPWKYRATSQLISKRVITDKRAACLKWCQAAERRLAQSSVARVTGDTARSTRATKAAVKCFRKALRIHPVKAAGYIFSHLWNTTRRDTTAELEARQSLAQVVEQFVLYLHPPSDTLIDDFGNRYPNFLPDPYLLQAYLKDTKLQPDLTLAASDLHALETTTIEWTPTMDRLRSFIQHTIKIVWPMLLESRNDDIWHAISLDDSLLGELSKPWMYRHSSRFLRHVAPLAELPRGQAYWAIATDLEHISANVESANLRTETVIDTWRSRIEAHLSNHDIEPPLAQALLDLHQKLEQARTDEAIDNEKIRGAWQIVISRLNIQAYKCFSKVAEVLEINEPQRPFSLLQQRFGWYRYALQTICPPVTTSIQSGFATLAYLLNEEETYPYCVESVDLRNQTVYITESGQEYPVLHIEGLKPEEMTHLRRELGREEFVILLNSPSFLLTPAYGVLLTQLPVPPLTAAWREVIEQMEQWLIKIMAYLAVQPVVQPSESDLAEYDDKPVIQQVVVSSQCIREQFARIYPQAVLWEEL